MFVLQYFCLQVRIRNLFPLMFTVLHILVPLFLERIQGFREIILDEEISDEVINDFQPFYMFRLRFYLFLNDLFSYLTLSYGGAH